MAHIYEGIRIIDLTNNLAGPLTTAMLADFGAEVIKVEKPVYGDDSRAWPVQIGGGSSLFVQANRGKKSIVLDFKIEADMEILRKLIKKSDVLVESFKPGVMSKHNLTYSDLCKLKPDIIMCSVSAFGQTGPYRDRPGYDLIAQAMSGVMDLTGNTDGPPMRLGPAVADNTTAYHAFGAIASALFHRSRTGEGQFIDVSLLECMTMQIDTFEVASAGQYVTRNGNHHSVLTPYGIFGKKSGSMMIAALNPKLWDMLTKLMGRPELADDPKYITVAERNKNEKELIPIIDEWVDSFGDLDRLEELLMKNNIPCAKVRAVKDLIDDPHLNYRGTLAEVDVNFSQTVPKLKIRGTAIKFSKTPGKPGSAPALGQHQEEILRLLAE
ncbi:MAG: Formyl-coenzyme A transferase [Smithella sp. PtaU1.Bin162]|nr:MAG: Formyl-coenzyme A transferase [Smithella sp. PtaU1.Bin162]